MSLSATAKWTLLALLGLAIAIGIAIAAANLTSKQIGIASESVSAGDALAPALNEPSAGRPRQEGGGDRAEPEPATTSPAEPPTATAPEERSEPPSNEIGEDRGGDSDSDDD